MAAKQSNEEMRREIIREDKTKDVNLYAAVAIAVFSGISSASGVLATLSIAFLEGFRKDVELFWLACTPFVFPVITGVSIAYHKQLASVGMHIALVLLTTAVGGAGYGITVEYVHFEKHNCTPVSVEVGDCDREVLVYLYVICGMIASGCAVFGLLLSLCACSNAMKRRAKREEEKEFRLQQEDDRRAKEVKTAASKPRPTMSMISPVVTTSPSSAPPAITVTKTAPLPAPPASPPAKKPTSVTATATQTGQEEISETKVNGINGVNGGINGHPVDSVTTHL